MQIDFHYCTIRVLTEKAGFSAEDAQIIAYASQYIDDAVDHKKINVEGTLDILANRFTGKTFDPVCTAHKGLQMIKAFNKDVQEKIYIPFHFLPEFDGNGSDRVEKDSKQSKKLVRRALIELAKSDGEKRVMGLVRLGITLHTYSDSWAHQNFSGRHSPADNDIGQLELFKDNEWKKIGKIRQIEYDTLPDIGHAEAGSYADQSHLKWRFYKESENKTYERDNTELFIDAAEHIIRILKGTSELKEWPQTKQKLLECFSYEPKSLEDKINKFQSVFPEIGFYYNDQQWRNEAINTVNGKKLINTQNNKDYVLGSDKKWFYFHLAALEQREYVLNLLENN